MLFLTTALLLATVFAVKEKSWKMLLSFIPMGIISCLVMFVIGITMPYKVVEYGNWNLQPLKQGETQPLLQIGSNGGYVYYQYNLDVGGGKTESATTYVAHKPMFVREGDGQPRLTIRRLEPKWNKCWLLAFPVRGGETVSWEFIVPSDSVDSKTLMGK